MPRVPASHKIRDVVQIRGMSFITPRQMALVIGCTDTYIKSAINRNEIATEHVGAWRMIPGTEIDRYAKDLMVKSAEKRANLVAETKLALAKAMAML